MTFEDKAHLFRLHVLQRGKELGGFRSNSGDTTPISDQTSLLNALLHPFDFP